MNFSEFEIDGDVGIRLADNSFFSISNGFSSLFPAMFLMLLLFDSLILLFTHLKNSIQAVRLDLFELSF